jgi:tRNA(Ile)-lysidine synthase
MAARRMRVLWLGHQQDDIAETMLMRLARGSGAGRPRRAEGDPRVRRPPRREAPADVHVAPLLSVKKAEIAGALRASGAAWREDSSNARARISGTGSGSTSSRAGSGRRRGTPSPGAALSRELLEEDDSALEAWVDFLGPIGDDGSLSVAGWPAGPGRSFGGPCTAGSSFSRKRGRAFPPGI